MNTEEILDTGGIKSTPNRMRILHAILNARNPLSLSELENELRDMDKSSIFRVLKLFSANHIVHSFEDGDGNQKYEICARGAECKISDLHTHFYCEVCHQTHCFEKTQIPAISVPSGYKMQSINYMVKGVCRSCMSSSTRK